MNREKLIEYLTPLANREVWSDENPADFNPCDLSGGNYDDAFSGGFESGETQLAREILQILKTE